MRAWRFPAGVALHVSLLVAAMAVSEPLSTPLAILSGVAAALLAPEAASLTPLAAIVYSVAGSQRLARLALLAAIPPAPATPGSILALAATIVTRLYDLAPPAALAAAFWLPGATPWAALLAAPVVGAALSTSPAAAAPAALALACTASRLSSLSGAALGLLLASGAARPDHLPVFLVLAAAQASLARAEGVIARAAVDVLAALYERAWCRAGSGKSPLESASTDERVVRASLLAPSAAAASVATGSPLPMLVVVGAAAPLARLALYALAASTRASLVESLLPWLKLAFSAFESAGVPLWESLREVSALHPGLAREAKLLDAYAARRGWLGGLLKLAETHPSKRFSRLLKNYVVAFLGGGVEATARLLVKEASAAVAEIESMVERVFERASLVATAAMIASFVFPGTYALVSGVSPAALNAFYTIVLPGIVLVGIFGAASSAQLNTPPNPRPALPGLAVLAAGAALAAITGSWLPLAASGVASAVLLQSMFRLHAGRVWGLSETLPALLEYLRSRVSVGVEPGVALREAASDPMLPGEARTLASMLSKGVVPRLPVHARLASLLISRLVSRAGSASAAALDVLADAYWRVERVYARARLLAVQATALAIAVPLVALLSSSLAITLSSMLAKSLAARGVPVSALTVAQARLLIASAGVAAGLATDLAIDSWPSGKRLLAASLASIASCVALPALAELIAGLLGA